MALQNVLANIPGLGGYLAKQQFDQQQQQGQLGQLLGIANLVETQKQRAMQQQMQQAQLAEVLRRSQEEQQAAQRLTALGQQFRQLQQPTTGTDAADNVTQTPGLAPDEALRRIYPEMIFDPLASVRQTGTQIGGKLEQIDARRETANAARAQRMQELQMRLDDARTTAQERMQLQRDLQAERLAAREDMARLAASLRQSGGGGDRREPIVVSVEGRNVQAWKDRAGNVFDQTGRVIQGYEPQVTAADQKAAQESASVRQAQTTLSKNIDRMEQLVNESPNTVAGPFSPALNVGRYVGGAVTGGAVTRPGREFSQLVEVSLNEAEKAGKLSNQQKDELRSIFSTGFAGDPDSVRKGIQLFRDYTGIRGATTAVPSARSRPGGAPSSGGASIPPPPPGFKVD